MGPPAHLIGVRLDGSFISAAGDDSLESHRRVASAAQFARRGSFVSPKRRSFQEKDAPTTPRVGPTPREAPAAGASPSPGRRDSADSLQWHDRRNSILGSFRAAFGQQLSLTCHAQPSPAMRSVQLRAPVSPSRGDRSDDAPSAMLLRGYSEPIAEHPSGATSPEPVIMHVRCRVAGPPVVR